MNLRVLAGAMVFASIGTVRAEPPASIFVTPGKTCPPDGRMLTYGEAVAAQHEACGVLGTWYIARLAEGGSMDGSGYHCGIRRRDDRDLGHVLCRREAPGLPISAVESAPRA